MLSQPVKTTFDIGGGRNVSLETGRLARQADGSVTVMQGNNILLATVVASREPREGQEFFPLTVDYMEKFASAGRIPGSFFKREGRLSEYEILISRLIDRALRPLFPEDYFCDVQVMVQLISSDPEVLPDSLACLAASAALAVSDIPIKEVISEVRVARIENEFVINPTRSQLAKADMDFMVAASEKNLVMVEGESQECSEEDLVKALQLAHDAIRIMIKAQHDLRAAKGVTTKREYTKPLQKEELQQKVIAIAKDKIYQISRSASDKATRSEQMDKIKTELVESLGDEPLEEDVKLVKKYYEDLKWEVVRNMILDDRIRLDGRSLDQVRPLDGS
jgi:polyribonucleotide nucleotidyltransferase